MNDLNDVNDVKMVNMKVNGEHESRSNMKGELIWEMFFSQLLYTAIHVRAVGTCIWKQLDLHKSKQGNTTNMNISFSMENEKRAAQVGLEPTTHCLRGRCSTH